MDLSPNYTSEDVMHEFNEWLQSNPEMQQLVDGDDGTEYVKLRNAFAAGMLVMEGSISDALKQVRRDVANANGTNPASPIRFQPPEKGGDNE